MEVIPATLSDGTVFPGQGGVLDMISIETFGIIVVVVLSVVVLLDSELTWMAQLLRWLRFRELWRARGGRRRDGPRMKSGTVGGPENGEQDSEADRATRTTPTQPEP